MKFKSVLLTKTKSFKMFELKSLYIQPSTSNFDEINLTIGKFHFTRNLNAKLNVTFDDKQQSLPTVDCRILIIDIDHNPYIVTYESYVYQIYGYRPRRKNLGACLIIVYCIISIMVLNIFICGMWKN